MDNDLLSIRSEVGRLEITAYDALSRADESYNMLACIADDVSSIKSTQCDVDRISALLDMLYQMMGISIYDAYGGLRDPRNVKQDILDLNPQIVLSFEDFMKMSAQENLK